MPVGDEVSVLDGLLVVSATLPIQIDVIVS
jgi:hypothetical protein